MAYQYCRPAFLCPLFSSKRTMGIVLRGPTRFVKHAWQWALYMSNTLCRCKSSTLIKTAPQWRYRCARSTEGENNPLHWASSIHSMTGQRHVSMRHTIRTCKWEAGVDRPRVFSHRLLLQGHEVLHQPEMDPVDHASFPSRRST